MEVAISTATYIVLLGPMGVVLALALAGYVLRRRR